MAVLYSNSDPKSGSHLNLLTPVESEAGSALLVDSVAEQEPRAEEPKLKSSRSPVPILRIAAPAPAPTPFCYHRLEKIYLEKIMLSKEVFVNCDNFTPIT